MNAFQKTLILGIALLLVGTSVIPLAESTESITEPPVSIALDGFLGDNGWFISCVTIIFTIIGGEVDYIMYKIDDGEWTIYTEPFEVCEDGYHTICWYYVDKQGNESEIECMDFKIDQTDPTIYFTTEKIGFRKWLLTADVSDETSGVAKVEFYVNGELLGEVREPPYEWIYNHRFSVRGLILNPKITEETVSFFAVMAIGHSVFDYPVAQAIVYDNAGNDRISDSVPVPPVSYSQSQIQSNSNLVPVQRRISLILGGLTGIQNTQRRV